MKIDNKNGLTIVIGQETKRIIEKTYDMLTTGAVNQYTYYFDRFNTNLVNYVYYHMRNNLRDILEETQKRVKNGDTQPVVVLMTNFDRMQTINEIEKIKKLIYQFIEDMPVPTHVYVVAETYEMCRKEEILISHTGDITKFADYEDYRNFVISLN